jgi:hypothetical protein
MVNISLFSTGPDVLYSFPATEMREHQDLYPRSGPSYCDGCVHSLSPSPDNHLVVTADSLVVLRELSDRAGWGTDTGSPPSSRSHPRRSIRTSSPFGLGVGLGLRLWSPSS